MSEIYCAHATARPWGYGGHLVCGLCGSEWYATDPAPLVVIAYTSAADVPRYKYLIEVRERQDNGGGGKIE